MSARTNVVRSLLFSAAALAIASPAWAQTAEETQAQAANQDASSQDADAGLIIVTATKRASTLQDVPFSINAQTQEDIQRANAQTIEDISRNVAGLTVQNLGPGQSQVSIRGVSAGQIIRDQPGVKEQVGVYMDESVISLSLFTPDFDLFDLNRVETLRGPQGTLFGSGSVGGTIRYITNQPKLNRTEGSIEANVNTVTDGGWGYSLKGAINAPLGENAAIRAVAYGTHYPGFIDAIGPAAGKDVNDGRRVGGRVSILWEPSTAIRITPRVIYQDVKANGFNREEHYNLYFNKYVSPSDKFDDREQYLKLREEFRDKTLLADLTASIVVAPEIELTSVSSYIHRDILVSRDASALSGSVAVSPLIPCCGIDPDVVNLPSNLRDTTKLKQWSQELRLASTGSSPFQWVFGGFYSHVDRKYAQRLPTPGYDAFVDAAFGAGTSDAVSNGFPADSPYNADLPYIIKQAALFGEASYDLGQFKLTAGGRYYDFKEERDFVSGGLFSNGDTRLGDKTKSSGFNPRVILTFEPNRHLTFNVQAAKGFRLGGINDPLNIPLCSAADQAIYSPFQSESYDDETLWNYEAGVKYQERGVNLSAAVFHTDIKNLQVTVDAGSCSSRIVLNSQGHSTGVEVEMSASPAEGLDLSLAGSFVGSKFDKTVSDPVLADRSGIRKGNRLPTVPRFQMAATSTYGERLNSNAEWYVSGTYQHVGSRYTQPGDQEAGASVFNFLYYNPANGSFGDITSDFGSLKLPGYDIFNASVGLKFDSELSFTLYVNNIFDTDTLLSFDRERGGRARIAYNVGQPRTFGLTVRKNFGSGPRPQPVAEPAPPPPPPPPATQTCADGSVILATDACPLPPAPPPPPPPAPEPERG